MKLLHYLSILLCTYSLFAEDDFFQSQRAYIDFDISMEFDKQDTFLERRMSKKGHPITNLCRALYNKNNLIKLNPEKSPLIPKIVHLIWVGPNTPPPVFKECLRSIKKHLPTWECKIWLDADVEKLTLINKKYYDDETNYGAKSDILRYELLYQFGGVYLDIDFILHKPLDILHHTYTFYASLMPSYTPDVIANGLIACSKGHPIIKECIDRIKLRRTKKSLIRRTGPIHFQKAFFEALNKRKQSRVIIFPKSYFIPLDKHDSLDFTNGKDSHVKPETFATHYWADSWSTK